MYRKIMVPVDGSELAECVLPHVKTIAEASGVESVVFVRVTEPLSITPVRGETGWLTEEQMKSVDDKSKAVAGNYLDNLASGLDYGNVTIQKEVLVGRAPDQLVEYAKKNDVDLIIVATHGRSGVSRWVLGSVADRLLHAAHVPVLMVRAPGA
jgi:nucleotide-binding universal stress UspA family protein